MPKTPNFGRIARSLPTKPGVYLFHDQTDEIIYVGKAKNLRNRVSSYFLKSALLPGAKQLMLGAIARIEHILVRSETEALLLESTLIKKHRPKYNILLKDDKYFQYIRIGLGEKFPSVSTVRRITLDGSRYFGPYTSGLSVRRTLRLLKRLFPYKTCTNPPEVPCFDFQLKRCLGHDIGPNSQRRYAEVIQKLIRFLEGHTGDIVKSLKQQMQAAARSRDFEQAAVYRDRFQALTHVLEQQTVVSPRGGHFDLLAMARGDGVAAVTLFQVRQGKLVQRDNFMLQQAKGQTDADVLIAFIEQYYSQSTNHPRELFTAMKLRPDFGQALQLKIHQARRGLKAQLLQTALENAADHLEREQVRWLSEARRAELGLRMLTEVLKLPKPPQRIEMYDISNVQGQYAVGSMVVFENGLPKNNQYKKFRIKSVRGANDMAMLSEVLRRRFAHIGEGAWPTPNLILLDGGIPQLSTVIKTVKNLPTIPIGALAKEHEELFLPRRATPLRLPHDSPGLHLLQRIRDEAHRYAIGYYRKRHARAATASRLDDVPGLGPSQKKKLLLRFGSLQGIRQAEDSQVRQIIGLAQTEKLRDVLG